LLNAQQKQESSQQPESATVPNEPFTDEQLKSCWLEFAEKRKIYQAEYQLLTQEYEIRNHQVIIHLHNPFQETLINTLRSDMTTFLREKLRNNTIQVIGELRESDEKKVIYTNREKMEHFIEKNPKIKELRDRLGLDPDF
jgi:hypothetical protein